MSAAGINRPNNDFPGGSSVTLEERINFSEALNERKRRILLRILGELGPHSNNSETQSSSVGWGQNICSFHFQAHRFLTYTGCDVSAHISGGDPWEFI